MTRRRVAVVGAGIVGAATAYGLSRDGHEVHLFEREAAPAQGASRANGAQLSYCYVEPLATPEVLRKLPGMLLDPASPVRFQPRWDWRQWRWGWQFLRACNAAAVDRSTRALLALSFDSRDALRAACERDDLRFEHAVAGKLVLCDSEAALQSAARQVRLQRAFGCEQHVLDAPGCLALEPALAPYAAHVRGGVWTPGEALGDARMLSAELVDRACRDGAQLHFGCEVDDLSTVGNRVDSVITAAGRFDVDAVVLATGASAPRLARRLGLDVPVYPIKGYSVTLPIVDRARAPAVSVTDLRRKTVYAPLGDRLRVAGFAELAGRDDRIDARRIEALVRHVGETFPGSCDLDADPQAWAGLRPATPSALPVIGRTPWDNVLLNVGHGALGFTLAMGSARIVQHLLAGRDPEPLAGAFAYRG